MANNPNEIIKENIIGNLPTSPDEIVISNALADTIIYYGISLAEENNDEFMNETIYQPKDYNELVNSNKIFHFGNKGQVKIIGVIEYDLSAFQSIKEKDARIYTAEDYEANKLLLTKSENTYNKIYVNEAFVNSLEVEQPSTLNNNTIYGLSMKDTTLQPSDSYAKLATLEEDVTYYNGTSWITTNQLQKNEMILNIRQLTSFDELNYQTNLMSYLKRNPEGSRSELEKKFFENYIKDYHLIGKTVKLDVYKTLPVYYGQTIPDKTYDSIKIIGLIGMSNETGEQYNYLSSDIAEEYKVKPFKKVGYVIPITEQKEFETVLEEFPYNGELASKTTYTESVLAVLQSLDQIKLLASWIGTGLLIFMVILIANFIATSIGYRKKEIGTLRALGARKMDVAKIFLWEGLVMSFISGTIACILLVITANILSTVLLNWMVITPLVVGVRQFVTIYLIVFTVTILSSMIPIIKISKMKPIDAILNK